MPILLAGICAREGENSQPEGLVGGGQSPVMVRWRECGTGAALRMILVFEFAALSLA